jgi:hypothetical protein
VGNTKIARENQIKARPKCIRAIIKHWSTISSVWGTCWCDVSLKYILMYKNGKMRSVETFQRRRERE